MTGQYAVIVKVTRSPLSTQAIREIAETMRDATGNMSSLPGVFPDYFAPIVRRTR
jgi:hypothetical protein